MRVIKKFVYELDNNCGILGHADIVGEKEKKGAFGKYFNNVVSDDKMGEKSFEKGERKMLTSICEDAIKNSKLKPSDVQL